MPISRARRDAVVEAAAVRIDVQVIAGGRAAGEQQLGHRGLRRYRDHLRCEVRPHPVETREPAEQLGVLRGRNRARQALIHVVMRVHEARNHQMPAHVEHFVGGAPAIPLAGADRHDAVVLDIQAAVAQSRAVRRPS